MSGPSGKRIFWTIIKHMMISVVMPVLNEGSSLRTTLSCLPLTEKEELIIVDGGSDDATVSIAQEFTQKVIRSGKGRACQMNAGAEKASGDLLLFLHADCILPDKGFDLIRSVLCRPSAAAGAFDIRIDHPGLSFRIIERAANLRSRLTSVPYGDQGLFMKLETFCSLRGFADLPLMEDIEIGRRLSRLGRIVFLRPPIRTSPRRWLKEGLVYTTLRDWTLAASFTLLKRPPGDLVKYYKDVR